MVEIPDDLDALIDQAKESQGHEPPAGAESRVWESLEGRILDAGAAGGAAASVGKAALSSKLVGTLAVVTLAGGAAIWVASSQNEQHGPHPSQVVMQPVASRLVEPPPPKPSAYVAPPPLEPPPAPSRAEAPPRRVEASAASSGRPDGLASETQLLRRAQQAARDGRKNEALKLLAEHAQRYPTSKLATPRVSLQAMLLCQVGRTSEGRRLGRSLVTGSPNSPFALRIRAACWPKEAADGQEDDALAK